MRKTKTLEISGLKIGGGYPISIQTMIKTPLEKVDCILKKIRDFKKNDCQLVRIAYKEKKESSYIKEILKKSSLPLEVDIHYNVSLALDAVKFGASLIRINPGNIRKKDLDYLIDAVSKKNIPVRVGVNIGSVPPRYKRKKNNVEAMVDLAREYIEYFEDKGFDNLLVSIKSDSVLETYKANIKIAHLFRYPIHLGVTATGTGLSSVIKSSIGIGALLLQGIGDTIRVSFTGEPLEEIRIAKYILSTLNLRKFGPEVISCPGCSRARINIIELSQKVSQEIEKIHTPSYLKIAVMGCEVNGPGEAREADIGVAGGRGCAVLFQKGKIVKKIAEKDIVVTLIKEIKNMLGERGGKK